MADAKPLEMNYGRTAGIPRMGTAERNFWIACLLAIAVAAVFWLIYKIERDWVFHMHPFESRFVGNWSEAAMRYITIPHFIIGFLFMASSPKNQSATKRLWIVGLLAAGTVLCALFGLGGAKASAVLTMWVYLYFMVHELRDEAMFYQVLGDAPPIPDKAAFNRMVRALIGALILITAAMAWLPAPFGLLDQHLVYDFAAWSLPAKLAVSVAPFATAVAVGLWLMKRHAIKLGFPDSWAMFQTHAPLFRISLGVLGVLGLSILFTGRAYGLILLHVTAWYVFATYQLRRHPPKKPAAGWWNWMRTHPRGFQFLHIGLVVLLIGIGLGWTYGLQHTAALSWLLSPEAFLYWTIMHITVSFVPR